MQVTLSGDTFRVSAFLLADAAGVDRFFLLLILDIIFELLVQTLNNQGVCRISEDPGGLNALFREVQRNDGKRGSQSESRPGKSGINESSRLSRWTCARLLAETT